MALWRAPSVPAQCTSPGAHGAPAQLPVGVATRQGHVSARTQRAVPPVATPSSQRAVICHHVQVRHRTRNHMNNCKCPNFRMLLTLKDSLILPDNFPPVSSMCLFSGVFVERVVSLD